MNEIKETVVNNRTVKIYQKGKGGSVILWGVGDNEDEALSKAILHLEEMLKADDDNFYRRVRLFVRHRHR